MNLSDLVRNTNKLMSDISPALLTSIGVTGTIATAYLAGKASFEAAENLNEEMYERDGTISHGTQLPVKERVKLVWRLYIPAVGMGTITVVAIVAANRVGSRRAAAMASAFAISERFSQEYKDKVIEKLGENKERAIRDEVAQERVRKNPPRDDGKGYLREGEVLFYEPYTGRYFGSTVETLKRAQNDTNYTVLHAGYASLTDFYDNAGIPQTSMSDELGWRSDKMLELSFSTTQTENGVPCMSFEYQVAPIRNFYKVHPGS